MQKNNLFLIGLFIITYVIIFKTFFVYFPLAWGDAPYFYSSKLVELFNPPLVWDYRTDNFGSFQGLVIWLYIPTFVMSLIYKILHINPDYLNQIVFYFPATILSFVGSFLLIKKYIHNTNSVFLGSLFFTLNTYILSVIDGGQVGVALGYSIFPFAILSLIYLLEKKNLISFVNSLFWTFLISNTDLRIFMLLPVGFLTIIFCFDKNWFKNLLQNWVYLLLLVGALLLSNFYWILSLWDFSKIYRESFTSGTPGSLFNLLHPFLLYHPNFPLNQFGKIILPPFYFVIVPLLLCISLLVAQINIDLKRRLTILVCFFLTFAFLAKGGGDPFGIFYNSIINNLPFGFAFRDSTKFFIPLILVFSFILSINVEFFLKKYSQSRNYIFILFYLCILLMVSPVLFGQMTGILGGIDNREHKKIAKIIGSDPEFYRTVYFPENTPFTYNSWSKPAISAVNLYKERPLASLIIGNYDLYNFLHNPNIKEWFRLLGIRYVVIDQNYRQKIWSEQELKDRANFLKFINNIFGENVQNYFSNKKNISEYIPVFELHNYLPHIFLQKKAFLVIGSEDIYDYLFLDPTFKLENNGFIFSEYPNTDLNLLSNVDPEALILIFNDTTKIDLTMSFLKNQIKKTQLLDYNFGFYDQSRYLDWKYELLKHGINTKDLDFGKGVFTSTEKGESIKLIEKDLPAKFYLSVRYTNASESSGLTVAYSNTTETLFNSKTDHFIWKLIGPIERDRSKNEFSLINKGGFVVVNIFTVIDERDLLVAHKKSDLFIEKYKSYNFSSTGIDRDLLTEFRNNYRNINYIQTNPTDYSIINQKGYAWLIFTDHYDSFWTLNTKKSLPFYNMVNGFYIQDLQSDQLRLYFRLQDNQNKATMVSVLSLLVIVLGTIIILVYKKIKHAKKL